MTNPPTLIQQCLERQLEKETYAKFLQVLGYVGEKVSDPLFRTQNELLVRKLRSTRPNHFSSQFHFEQHIALVTSFYSFRLISQIGHHLVEGYHNGDDKVEENMILLMKVLLHHGLISKTITANLALVELEQLCRACRLTLSQLYYKYRTKFLRLIIKAILQKLTIGNEGPGDFRMARFYCRQQREIPESVMLGC